MPCYLYKCETCTGELNGEQVPLAAELRQSLDEVGTPGSFPTCPECDVPMKRDYGAEHPYGLIDLACVNKGIFPRLIHNLGTHGPVMVESQDHRRQLMKERGLVEYEADADSRANFKEARKVVVGGSGTMPNKDGTGHGGPNKPTKMPIKKPSK